MVSVTDIYTFKSDEEYFEDEKKGLKNNTVKEIDLNDERFQDLMVAWKKGIKPKIRINRKLSFNGQVAEAINTSEDQTDSFMRYTQHIAVCKKIMIITWEVRQK